jgi:predicted GNAT family acetyltransferase
MTATAPPLAVHHDAVQQRFHCTVQGHLCVANYRLGNDGVMHMTHTEVHPSLQGHGIAAALVEAALAHARAHGLRIDPQCAYVRAYLQRHPFTA